MRIGSDVRALPAKVLREHVLEGLTAGRPVIGPMDVHLDVTNACNAACVTCWDHSPHLTTPRTPAWKGRTLSWERFSTLVRELDRFGSVRHVVLSGMGEPLTHPRIYDMIAEVKRRGWRLTILSNLVAADVDKLASSGVDAVLAGVQGATPDVHSAFHPGWDAGHFFKLCKTLRALASAGVRVRHVQVIDTHTAEDFVEMVRFGNRFRADRVNYKLASLAHGTESVRITDAQRARLSDHDIPEARALADELGVRTNLDLFARQLTAGGAATTPMDAVGCAMGFAYTRITVDGEILFCCNTAVEVGHVDAGDLVGQWFGPRWQQTRERIARHEWFEGCDRCGKFEQNVKWRERRDARTP
jgi:MoaA/NifB/PqqE/SkfB family radical SAM enzyme